MNLEERPHPIVSRREWLRRAGLGLGCLGLGSVFAAASNTSGTPPASALRVRAPHFAPRAKRIIHIFLNGGLSHVDSFDPKPMLTRYDGKPLPSPNLITERPTGAAFGSPFAFKQYGQSGLPISELFSELGEHADDLCVIRSMVSDVPNHEPALMLMNCGDNTLSRPSMGSWLTYGLGSENQNLPGFVAMCPEGHPVKGPDNWRSSFLPGIYEGAFVDTKHESVDELIQNIRHPSMDVESQRRQMDLLQALNRRHQSSRGYDPALEARIQSFEQGYRMQMEASDAFDVDRETEATRERYGKTVQSRQLLIARRLVERGVRFVQVFAGGWDSHDYLQRGHSSRIKTVDQPMAALIKDLKARGMLDETLVVWTGEFGRTPDNNKRGGVYSLGRGHNADAMTMLLAGGGVRKGVIVGATDELGATAADVVHPIRDFHVTLLQLLGLDDNKLTYFHGGRFKQLSQFGGKAITDLLA